MSSVDPSTRPGAKGPPVFNSPPFVLWTCGVILLCSLAYFYAGPRLQDEVLVQFSVVPYFFLSQFSAGSEGPSFSGMLPLVSHVLLHANALHLFVNLGFLLAFGTVIERSCGGWQMLAIFLASAAAGALLQVWSMGPQRVPVIGASGAVFGLMGTTLSLLLQNRISRRLRGLSNAIFLMLGLNVVFALTGVFDWLSGLNVAWEAHLGGFAAGVLLGFVTGPRAPPTRASDTSPD